MKTENEMNNREYFIAKIENRTGTLTIPYSEITTEDLQRIAIGLYSFSSDLKTAEEIEKRG
jgi:hypothetical protein